MRFKIDWASLIAGRKFTVFALFYLVFEAISKYKPPPPSWGGGGGLIFGGAILRRVFLRYEFGRLMHGGTYFRNFTVSIPCHSCQYCCPSLLCFKTTVFYLAFIIPLYFIYQHLPIILFDIIIRL